MKPLNSLHLHDGRCVHGDVTLYYNPGKESQVDNGITERCTRTGGEEDNLIYLNLKSHQASIHVLLMVPR